MSLNAKERAEYLDTLRTHGGEKALHAGLDLLKALDSGKPLPKENVPKLAKPHAAAKEFDALATQKVIDGGLTKKEMCNFRCLWFLKDPKFGLQYYAVCVFRCMHTK